MVFIRNITLSIDEATLKRGRADARQHNISFNGLVRRLVEQTVTDHSVRWLEDAFALMDRQPVSSGGKKWTRDELYRV